MRVKSFIGSIIRITNQLSATIGYLRSFINGKDYRLNHLTLGVSANFNLAYTAVQPLDRNCQKSP